VTSIKREPSGRWRARYRDPSGREHSKRFDRKVDAQQWLDGVTTSMGMGTYVDPAAGRETLGGYARTWLDRQPQLSPSTAVRYDAIVRNHVMPAFGSVPLARMERSAVTAWVAEAGRDGLAADTIRHVHRVLAMILASAVADGKVARNVAAGVPLPRAVKGGKRYLTHEQVAALADAAGEHRAVILTLGYCGLRFGELAALRVGRVNLLRKRIEVAESATEVRGHMVHGEPKSHQRRSVAVPPFLLEEIARACEGKGEGGFVFTAPAGGVLWLRNFRRRVFDPAVAAAGLGDISPHELRHTAASLAVSAGANVKAVQRMLGHASAAMTLDVYADLFEDELDQVAERMDTARGQAASSGGNPASTLRPMGPVADLSERRSTL
jgi:integrase